VTQLPAGSDGLDELGPGVFVWRQHPAGHGRANAGIVVEDDGATLIDAMLTPSQARPLNDALATLGVAVRRLVLTSSHVEYVGGTSVFWMAARYGRSQTSALLDQPPNLEGYRRLYPDWAIEFDADFSTRPISHTVDTAAWLSPLVCVVPTTGQMAENLMALVPSADTLFGGAMCTFGTTPNAFDGNPEVWADSLSDVAEMAGTIVPGIGPVGGADEVVALQAYLYACVEAEGDSSAIPEGPWDDWADRHLDEVNVERAAMLAAGDESVPPSMLRAIGLA
jgi:glyoxylase-like metal-dependent hydrolase (beta-lactamase superfamily II)